MNIDRTLDDLLRRADITSIEALHPQLEAVADHLVRTGTLPVVAGVLADAGAPAPARLRALGRAAAAIRRRPVAIRLDDVA